MTRRRVYIVAEMSSNHCGDFYIAKKIIRKAKDIGCDAVKIQTYTADAITMKSDNDIFKITDGGLWNGRFLYDLYQESSTPLEWQKSLKLYADEIGIDFFSTPFDCAASDFLDQIGVSRYKIASFEAFDFPFIRYIASKKKPMIISTGISTLEEMQEAIDTCHSVGNYDVTLLKCTSEYPSSLNTMNILTIQDMLRRFEPQGVKIGLSDHSLCIEPAIAAVALGACVVEKHIMLNSEHKSSDSAFSSTIDQFSDLVQALRRTEKCLGDVNYTFGENSRVLGRSLFIVKDVKCGERITKNHVRSIRPGIGLHPRYYDRVLNGIANRDLVAGTPLRWDDFHQG